MVDGLNESTGSRISATFKLWNSMNAGISRADSGESYLMPCLMDIDLSRRRAMTGLVKMWRICIR